MSTEFRSNLQTISPRKAEKLLVHNTYGGQRRQSDQHIDLLAEKIKDGRFHTGLIATVELDGETYLVNGQHQLKACIKSGVSFRATVHEYVLNGRSTMSDVAAIYAQYDVDKKRIRSDIAHAKAAALGWGDWPLALKRNLAAALDSLRDIDEFCASAMVSTTLDETGDAFKSNQKVCEWVASVFSGNPKCRKHLNRVAVIAAMIATYRICQSDAEAFWSQVRDGDELSKRSPAYVLREFLMSATLRGGVKNPQQKSITGWHPMYAKCIHAWNATREDRGTVLRYNPNQPLPKPV